jgi:hypothetical protein
MTRLFAVIALGALLLVSPARAQIGNWLEGMWPTVPEQIPMPRADGSIGGWWDWLGGQALCYEDWAVEYLPSGYCD